ncbi:MAG TPA: response regulator transcription factor [Burkholderiales bacterium]|nr:response regulator transcription factor [Burkholderiales bacterium]
MRIAILEDDVSQSELLSHWLQLAGHHPHAFEQGTNLLRALQHESYDALLLDWNVPDLSGVDVLRRVRQQLHSSVPILFVTGRNREDDIVLALREGADDYMIKPVRRLELLARLEALARRARHVQEKAEVLEVDVFKVDCQTRTVLREGKQVDLTAKDFDLSVLFLRNIGRLLSRGHIRETVWGPNAVVTSRTLDTHVSRIRNKLGLTPDHGWRLAAVYRYGYRLEHLDAAALQRLSANADPKAAA